MAELFIAGFPLQCFVLHPHRFVALARNFLQPLAIFDFDVPPAIANKPGLLERMRGYFPTPSISAIYSCGSSRLSLPRKSRAQRAAAGDGG
jgi:hypothetical protein